MIGLSEQSRKQAAFYEPFTPADFEMFQDMLDNLYDAAMRGNLCEVSAVDRRLIAGWLRDIVNTSEEILQELEYRCPDANCYDEGE